MDNKEELLKVIEKGESEKVEFKKSTAQMERALKAMCAFLNHKGGVVYFGISDKNELIGQDVSDSTLKTISQKIRQKIKPEVSPGIKVFVFGGKKVIEVKVAKGTNKPYYLDGIAYKRAGSESPVIAPEELEKIILRKKKTYWDSEICEGSTLDDIDKNKVNEYIQRKETVRGITKESSLSFEDILKNTNAVTEKDGKSVPTRAGILLFGKDPQGFIAQSEIRLARFKGTEMIEFIDSSDLRGTLPQMIENALIFVKRNIRLSSKVVGVSSKYQYEYPLDAVREAIINGVTHRDYNERGSTVRVAIFDDRIEIISPGSLPHGVTFDNNKHKLRNTVIGHMMYDIGLIEKWGSGIPKMRRLMKEQGLDEPVFTDSGDIVVTFRGPGESILELIKKPEIQLNERQKEALKYISEYGKVKREEYSKLFGCSERTAFNDLNNLFSVGIIEKTGGGKYTYYRLSSHVQSHVQ
ncbi:MAG: putative DNA binding domain-containing protein, partial [Candidatus Aenigmarchaeota archaeon]|nr:putative DNA binding domain-containing protein [Candidatus Aenigmarchaeota archaeon]